MRIGIIGGGQLGMMMAESAIKLKHDVFALDHNLEAPIKHLSQTLFTDGFMAPSGYMKLYHACDTLTYEFENVSLDWVKAHEDKIPQKVKALELSRHRLIEKNFAKSLDIPTPAFEMYDHEQTYQFPFIIKIITMGYDGHGQYVIKEEKDLTDIKDVNRLEFIKEEIIKFDYELSVVLTRDRFGHIVNYPIPKNVHKEGILHLSIVDQSIDQVIQDKAIQYAKTLIEALDYIGTLAVEFFVVGDEVLFNEYAPRPHNSGHYTIEGCNVSQFDNHILAVTGQKVIEPFLLQPTIMLNILGKDMNLVDRCKHMNDVYVHLYGKTESRPYRKMGHITITGEDCFEKLTKIIGDQQ